MPENRSRDDVFEERESLLLTARPEAQYAETLFEERDIPPIEPLRLPDLSQFLASDRQRPDGSGGPRVVRRKAFCSLEHRPENRLRLGISPLPVELNGPPDFIVQSRLLLSWSVAQ